MSSKAAGILHIYIHHYQSCTSLWFDSGHWRPPLSLWQIQACWFSSPTPMWNTLWAVVNTPRDADSVSMLAPSWERTVSEMLPWRTWRVWSIFLSSCADCPTLSYLLIPCSALSWASLLSWFLPHPIPLHSADVIPSCPVFYRPLEKKEKKGKCYLISGALTSDTIHVHWSLSWKFWPALSFQRQGTDWMM